MKPFIQSQILNVFLLLQFNVSYLNYLRGDFIFQGTRNMRNSLLQDSKPNSDDVTVTCTKIKQFKYVTEHLGTRISPKF